MRIRAEPFILLIYPWRGSEFWFCFAVLAKPGHYRWLHDPKTLTLIGRFSIKISHYTSTSIVVLVSAISDSMKWDAVN